MAGDRRPDAAQCDAAAGTGRALRGRGQDQFGNARLAFHASGSITRRDFGITNELLKEAGGLLVGKDVAIDIDAEAIRPL